jgi:penicillin amidase
MAWRRGLRAAAWALAAIVALLALLAAFAWAAMHRSVPALDGDLRLPGLGAPLAIERDALGTAVLRGANRLDVARGLGFVHAQERFFEMDLARRSAAGELSALFGPIALDHDRARRVHRLRTRLAARFAQMDEADRTLLQAYAAGVNAGLDRLDARPWQYLLLRARPEPWQPVDSLLVIGEMYWMLQASSVDGGFERALLRRRAGDALFEFLEPRGGRWDAALDGSVSPPLVLPGPELLDLRHARAASGLRPPAGRFALAWETPGPREALVGSNDWALAAARTSGGGALLADDMHLGLSAPSIWFRAQFEIGRGDGAIRAEGVTLPGLPAIVVGSNGAVAWGFTNAYGQWFDWIELPADLPPARLARGVEHIAVKGGAAVDFPVAELDGAPVARERDGRSYAVRWIADQGEAYNLALDGLLGARDVDGALAIAQRAGMPHQNFVAADRAGHIGWTIAGRLWSGPRGDRYGRFEAPGLAPAGWLAPAAAPRVKDPAGGQLWTANARQLGGADGEAIGDGGFDLGARAQQIRDRLAAAPRHDEASLRAIQLDDDAPFMRSWRDRVLPVVAASPAHAQAAALLRAWNGRADADQAGYRLLRGVRLRSLDALWAAWTTPLLGDAQADADRRIGWHGMFEYSAAQALDARPAHLLPPPFRSWDEFVLAQVDAVSAEMTQGGRRPLAQASWGEANASRIRHVLSRAVPALARLLDMPSRPQGGDANLPHVAGPAFGQSERFVVSPGHEERATLSMPGGQSGHPLSPYYGAGHAAWADGAPTPLLAGPAQHVLRLAP